MSKRRGITPRTPSSCARRRRRPSAHCGLRTLTGPQAGPWPLAEGSPSEARRRSRDPGKAAGPLDSAPRDAHLLRKSRTPWTLWTPWTSRRRKSLRENG